MASRDLIRRIVPLMEQELTGEEIAKRLGTSQPVIATAVRKRDLQRVSEMLDLIDRGYSMEEIGKSYGLSRQRVAQLIGTDRVDKEETARLVVTIPRSDADSLEHVLDAVGVNANMAATGLTGHLLKTFLLQIATGELSVKRV